MVINSLNCIYHGEFFFTFNYEKYFFLGKSLTLTAMFISQFESLLRVTVVLFLELTLWIKYLQSSYNKVDWKVNAPS